VLQQIFQRKETSILLGMATVASNPWFVYLLATEEGQTYVGATVDPDRRLRQHNGLIGGGARATAARVGQGLTWKRMCYVSGFPDNHAALQFEWRWKSLSRKKELKSLDPVSRRMEALQQLLALDRPTTKAAPYSSYVGGKPEVIWESNVT
jgi:structure-specific endonuclease subunit SLX1